jgi:hypothetical protein
MAKWKRSIRGINVVIDKVADGQIPEPEGMGRIADILRKQPEFIEDETDPNCDPEFKMLVEEMDDARRDETMEESYFDALLAGMYDWADAERVWIEPVASLP